MIMAGEDSLTVRSIWGFLTGGMIPWSLQAGITAEPAGIQGDVPLTKSVNEVSVCATSGDSVTLYSGLIAGITFQQTIFNNGAAPLGIFPALGHDCGAGANNKITIGPGANITFKSYSATAWETRPDLQLHTLWAKGPAYWFNGITAKVESSMDILALDTYDDNSEICVHLLITPDMGASGSIFGDINSNNTDAFALGFTSDQAVQYACWSLPTTTRRFKTDDGAFSDGEPFWLTVTKVGDADVKIYVNGIENTSRNASGWDNGPQAANRTIFGREGHASGSYYEGLYHYGILFNLVPTQAQILNLLSGEIPAKWQFGSQTELVTNGDFSSFVGWSHSGGWSQDAGNNEYDFDDVTTGYIERNDIVIEKGKLYLIQFTIKNCASTGNLLLNNENNEDLFGDDWDSYKRLANGTYRYEYIATASSGVSPKTRFWGHTGGTDSYSITDISIIKLGALALLTPDSISETKWHEKAQGNDFSVTEAEVLNYDGKHTDGAGNLRVDKHITNINGGGSDITSFNTGTVAASGGTYDFLIPSNCGGVLILVEDNANDYALAVFNNDSGTLAMTEVMDAGSHISVSGNNIRITNGHGDGASYRAMFMGRNVDGITGS